MDLVKLPPALRLLQKIEFPHKLGICERLFGQALAKNGICWVMTSIGIPWKLDLSNSTLRWIVFGKYEGAAFFDWARRQLPSNGVVVDSGANIGQMLLYFAHTVPRGKILAIEPGRHQADWLQECLQVHPQLPVTLIRCALGSSEGHAFLNDDGPVGTHGGWSQVSQTQGNPIEVKTLGSILNATGVSRVDLWKLDVEGFEVPALEGAADWLRDQRIRAIWVEMSGENGTRIRNYLSQFQYTPHVIGSRGVPAPAQLLPKHCNVLFLPAKGMEANRVGI